MLHALFPRAGHSGLVLREIEPPGGPAITVVYLLHLVSPADLERLVLTPLAHGTVGESPAAMARSGRFPAAHLRLADESEALASGLVSGLVALHVDGHSEVLLVGSGLRTAGENSFGSDLDTSMAVLHRQLRQADIQTEEYVRPDGSRFALVYLRSRAAQKTVQAARTWALNLSPNPARPPWWRTWLNALRLPPALESDSPDALAEALTDGYVAIFKDNHGYPMVAPTTLNMLFSSPGDIALRPPIRRLIAGPRVLVAIFGLTLSAAFVAISSYHHSLMPGPFLVALTASRGNLPFPVVGEILLASLLSDAFQAAAMRAGERKMTVPALIATVVALMAMMQVGVIGGVSGSVIIVESALRATLPNPALRRVVRLWRYFFIGAAAGLGVYGMTLLLFIMMVYLGEERALEHPVRLPPPEVSP
ncbi:MAG: spore germination protein [Bacillota bacterium]